MTPQHHGWVSSCARLSPLFSPLLPWPRHLHRRRLRASAPWAVSAAAAHLTLDLEAAAAPTPALEIQLASEEEEAPVDEREMLRRMRISQANKGNTPWNKGRKHSPETLQRIKERTRIAMQDPKVKQKLMNLGHAQSEETRLKIAQGVRRGWSLRRKKLMVQDGCFVEWRDIIADAARNGFAGGVALQWNSYKILTEKLQQDWLENLQKRRSMPRPRGNRRAPKTPEQRKKISEAIAAKWLDQGYRERVCSGITNYHGTPGTKTPRKSKPPKEPTVKRGHVKNKLIQTRSATIEAKVQTTAIAKRKKSGTPYKDPMAGEKLEMITKIRAQRAALETEKKEAIKRARALIAEAEKAADALEAVATRSSFVQASLVETRKLVAEARKSLRCAVDDKPPTQNASDDTSADSARFELDSYNLENQNNVMVPENKPVNGIQLPLSTVNGNYHFDVSDTFNEMKQFRVPHSIESSMERAYLLPSPSTALENVNKGLNVTNFHVSQSMANEAVRYDQTAEERTENDPSGTLENKVSSPMTKPKMRWMRGRLVEAGEE